MLFGLHISQIRLTSMITTCLCPSWIYLHYITCKSGFWRDAKITNMFEVFCMTGATRRPGNLDLVALWPLKLH
jgi:hypothetical protein